MMIRYCDKCKKEIPTLDQREDRNIFSELANMVEVKFSAYTNRDNNYLTPPTEGPGKLLALFIVCRKCALDFFNSGTVGSFTELDDRLLREMGEQEEKEFQS